MSNKPSDDRKNGFNVVKDNESSPEKSNRSTEVFYTNSPPKIRRKSPVIAILEVKSPRCLSTSDDVPSVLNLVNSSKFFDNFDGVNVTDV